MSRPATITAYHAAQHASDRAVMNRLRKIIDDSLPDAHAKIWHAHPVWFDGDNPLVGYSRLKDGVRLMFWSGQSFDRPGLSPSGSFKAAEILFNEAEEIDDDSVRAWCRDAWAVQWDYANIQKRKGRLERLK